MSSRSGGSIGPRLKTAASARQARRCRQAACTTVSASTSSRASRGASAERSSARNRSKSCAASPSTTAARDVSPCRRPFRLDIAFPTAVLGPVLLKALWRLAAIWAGVAMAFLSRQPMRGIRFKGRTELSYPLGVQAA
jgi:hypothetical protein